jgi:hypothetical protein
MSEATGYEFGQGALLEDGELANAIIGEFGELNFDGAPRRITLRAHDTITVPCRQDLENSEGRPRSRSK